MSSIVARLAQLDRRIRQIPGTGYQFPESVDQWISQTNRWILYPAPTIKTKKEAISADVPNVWVSLPNTDEAGIGIAYQTKPLVARFLELDQHPNKEAREALLSLLGSVSNGWFFTVNRKTRWYTHTSSPEYKEQKRVECNKLDWTSLLELVVLMRHIRDTSHKRGERVDGRRVDTQGPAFDLMFRETSLSKPDFDRHIVEVFGVFDKCQRIKPPNVVKLEMQEVDAKRRMLLARIQETEKKLAEKNLAKERRQRFAKILEVDREKLAALPETSGGTAT